MTQVGSGVEIVVVVCITCAGWGGKSKVNGVRAAERTGGGIHTLRTVLDARRAQACPTQYEIVS